MVARRARGGLHVVPQRHAADSFVSLIYQGVLQNPTKGIGSNYMPVFSPDGTQIAFMSNRDGNPEIYVMNRDGSNVRRLTNHPAGDVTPTWSPTGSADRVHVGSHRHERRRFTS